MAGLGPLKRPADGERGTFGITRTQNPKLKTQNSKRLPMVGLVLVSHSRPLAEAVANLARRAVNSDLKLTFSGGVGEYRLELGTDAIEIREAISAVYSEDGVLVLMDMGSAILSAET